MHVRLPSHTATALRWGVSLITGLTAYTAVDGLFGASAVGYGIPSREGPLFFAIPSFSAACAYTVFAAAKRWPGKATVAALLSAMAVGIANFLALVLVMSGFSIDSFSSVVVSVLYGSIIGGAFGFGFGLLLLPAVHLAKQEKHAPSVDGVTRVASCLSAYSALTVFMGRLGTGHLLDWQPRPVVIVAAISAVVFALVVIFRDLALLRTLRRARHGTHGLRLRALSSGPLPFLFRPRTYGPIDELVSFHAVNRGPFRDERTERVIARVPRGAPRPVYIRLALAAFALALVAFMQGRGILLVSPL